MRSEAQRRAQLSARDLPPETIRTSVRAWLTRAATGDRTPETLANSKKLAVGVAFDTMCPNWLADARTTSEG